jgi:hypothetical protein
MEPTRARRCRPTRLNWRTFYQLTKNVEVSGLINNALEQHYYLFGTFTDIGASYPSNSGTAKLGILSDPRTYVPGAALRRLCGREHEVLSRGTQLATILGVNT